MEWKPIETAPMDGTWILVTGFKKGKEKTISHMYAVAAWYPISERRPELGGFWFFGDKDGLYVREPTHWMELPMLPKRA